MSVQQKLVELEDLISAPVDSIDAQLDGTTFRCLFALKRRPNIARQMLLKKGLSFLFESWIANDWNFIRKRCSD